MHAGDIITVDFGIPMGSGPGFERPVVIVTTDRIVAQMPRTFHVAPVTSNVQRAMATDIPVQGDGLAKNSVGQCHLPTVVEIERIKDGGCGNVGPVALAHLRSVIADLLDLHRFQLPRTLSQVGQRVPAEGYGDAGGLTVSIRYPGGRLRRRCWHCRSRS